MEFSIAFPDFSRTRPSCRDKRTRAALINPESERVDSFRFHYQSIELFGPLKGSLKRARLIGIFRSETLEESLAFFGNSCGYQTLHSTLFKEHRGIIGASCDRYSPVRNCGENFLFDGFAE